MLRHTLAIAVLLLPASAVTAATLTVTPDKSEYQVGETITLSIVGDSQGGATILSVTGFLRFDTSLASWQSTDEQRLTSFGGALVWRTGAHVRGCSGSVFSRPGCPVFDQISGVLQQIPVDNLLLSTLRLTALAPGVLDLIWETDRFNAGGEIGYQLTFFDLTNAPGTSVLIHNPEPGTAALLGLGLFALALSRRAPGVAR